MRRIHTALVAWTALALVVAGATALLAGGDSRAHALAGLFAAFLAALTPSLLLVHWIGTMKWMEQVGTRAGLPDTRALRTAWVRGPAFPWTLAAAVVPVAAAATGPAASDGLGGPVHALLGALSLGVVVVAGALARGELARNLARQRDLEARAREQETRGEADAPPESALRLSATRAGARVLLFLALQAWLVFAYVRWVLRERTPVWPWAVASVVLLLLGLALLGHGGTGAPRRPPAGDA